MNIKDIRNLPEANEQNELPPQTIYRKYAADLTDLIKNRLLVGYARYGAGRSAWKEQVINDHIDVTLERMLSKLIQFIWTFNLEFLVDIVVYSYLIWRFGAHPKLHFEAVERHNIQDMKSKADKYSKQLLHNIRQEKFK